MCVSHFSGLFFYVRTQSYRRHSDRHIYSLLQSCLPLFILLSEPPPPDSGKAICLAGRNEVPRTFHFHCHYQHLEKGKQTSGVPAHRRQAKCPPCWDIMSPPSWAGHSRPPCGLSPRLPARFLFFIFLWQSIFSLIPWTCTEASFLKASVVNIVTNRVTQWHP